LEWNHAASRHGTVVEQVSESHGLAKGEDGAVNFGSSVRGGPPVSYEAEQLSLAGSHAAGLKVAHTPTIA